MSTKRASRIHLFNLACCLHSIQDRLGLSVVNDGNQHAHGLRTPTGDARSMRKRDYQSRRTTGEKLEIIFSSLRQVDCSLGEFHYNVFWTKDEKRRMRQGRQVTPRTTLHTASSILELWFSNPDGCVYADSSDRILMYFRPNIC